MRRARTVAMAGLAAALAFVPARGEGSYVRPARLHGPAELIFSITDDGLRGPATVVAGHIVIKLNNHTSRPHQIGLALLPRNRDARRTLDSMVHTGTLPRGLTPSGGIGPIMGGKTASVLLRLPPGQYLVYCLLSNGPDGRPFFMHGMAMTLEATGNGAPNMAYEDATAGALVGDARWRFGNTTLRGTRRVMFEGRTRMTEVIRGAQSLQVENGGGPTHAFVLLRADDPTVMEKYVAWLDGRGAPPEIVSGIPNLPGGGQREYLRLDLRPGGHIIFCPNFHARSGLRGFQTGEFTEFIVR